MCPVGPWPNFDACVAAMEGKVADAPAFCNWAERNMAAGMTGAEGVSLHAALDRLPEETRPAAREAYVVARQRLGATHDAALAKASAVPEFLGWQRAGLAWARRFRAPASRTVADVEVFAVGTWTDSAGETREWKLADLKQMVAASKEGIPAHIPVKAGHTQDGFNARLAEALGVPPEVVTGQQGQGQIALGEVVNLRVKGDKLLGDFADVPEPIAALVEMQGHAGFTNVSAEIEFDLKVDGKTWPRVLCGVALLGAEAPAVEALAGLEAALVFSAPEQGRRAYRLPFTATVNDPKRHQQEDKMLDKLKEMLGLAPDATDEQVLAAVASMKEQMAGMTKAAEQTTAQHAAFSKQQEGLQKRITDLETAKAALEHRERVAKYSTRAAAWKHLTTKPAEMGETLAGIEEKAGADVAEQVAAQHDAAADVHKRSALFTQVSNPRSGGPADPSHPLEKEMREWAEKNGKTFQQANAHFQQTQPDKFRAYLRDSRAENHAGA